MATDLELRSLLSGTWYAQYVPHVSANATCITTHHNLIARTMAISTKQTHAMTAVALQMA
jgi:hypothetical protein